VIESNTHAQVKTKNSELTCAWLFGSITDRPVEPAVLRRSVTVISFVAFVPFVAS
jgi:hypothetical protein